MNAFNHKEARVEVIIPTTADNARPTMGQSVMSVEASTYLVRHVRGITTAQRAFLDVMANLSNTDGRTRIALRTVAEILGLCRRQVERHARSMREAGHLIRQGRTWFIAGVADHDMATCDHPWCAAQHTHRTRPRTRPRPSYANSDTWQQLPTARPAPLATALIDAAAAAGERVRKTFRKHKRGKIARPP